MNGVVICKLCGNYTNLNDDICDICFGFIGEDENCDEEEKEN